MKNIIIAALVILVAVVGYFAFVKKSGPIAQQPTPTPNETVNWKTYTNTKYGFEFKHPTGTELSTAYSAKEGGPATGRDDNVYVASFLQIELVNPLGNCSDLRSESAIRACLGSQSWAQSDTWTPVTIGGQPAVKRGIKIIPTPLAGSGIAPIGYIYYLNYGKIGFQISSADSAANQIIADKILSTFKFTK